MDKQVVLGICLLAASIFVFFWFGRYKTTNPYLRIISENLAKLNPTYGNIPLLEGSDSYTDYKTVITLCIRDPKTGLVYDPNTIMYVALHELAHVITPNGDSSEHGVWFNDNFKKLKEQAASIGIFNPEVKISDAYCGINRHQ